MTEAKELNRIRMKAVADGVDEVAVAMGRKWGVDRLQRLVSDDLRNGSTVRPGSGMRPCLTTTSRKSRSTAPPCERAGRC